MENRTTTARDRPAIKITPEMREAGVEALCVRRELWGAVDPCEEAAAEVYIAMARKAPATNRGRGARAA